MPRRVKDFRGLTEESRVRLLHAVQRHPGQALKDLASEAEVHLNTARDHLRVLEAEGFVVSAPVDTGRRGRPPLGYWPVVRSEHSPAAQERAEEAGVRGELCGRLSADRDVGQALEQSATHQLDVLYEHVEDAGMDPVVNSDDLTVAVRPCISQGLLDAELPVVCSVHAKLV